MPRIAAVLATSLALLMFAIPVSADRKEGDDRGPAGNGADHATKAQHAETPHDKGETDEGETSHQNSGLHLGQIVHGLQTDDQVGHVADALQACVTAERLDDMRLGQLQRLAHAAGLSTEELRNLLDDSSSGRGLGRLQKDGVSDEGATELADALREGLGADDIRALTVGRLVQASHACGLTSQDLVDLLTK